MLAKILVKFCLCVLMSIILANASRWHKTSSASRDVKFGHVGADWRPVVRLHRHQPHDDTDLTTVYEVALLRDPCDDEASINARFFVSQRWPAKRKPGLRTISQSSIGTHRLQINGKHRFSFAELALTGHRKTPTKIFTHQRRCCAKANVTHVYR